VARGSRPASATVAACALAWLLGVAHAQTLRVGLAEDPDILDPTLGRTFVGRVIFAALCDKLFDIDERLAIVPQLATRYEWSADNRSLTVQIREGVTFHDGEKLDAAAVKFNLDRHRTMPGSNRRSELAPVVAVEVVDPRTVRLDLSAPYSPLLGVLADSAGIMVSPKAARASGDKFGAKPVCSGPFRFVERVAQDRILLERYPGYWDKADIHLDRIVYLPIPDSTVRLANLLSGQLDFVQALAPSDVPRVKGDSRLKLTKFPGLGYQGITINVGKSELARKNALGRDPRVREAFELSLDREGIVQFALDGEALVGNQWVAPTNPYYAKNAPVPKRDLARAKALLHEAGMANPRVSLMTTNTPLSQRIAEVVQAMAREAGFAVEIKLTEFATSLDMADKGDFDAYAIGWSGRADPDGNLFRIVGCSQSLNVSGYCNREVDALLLQSRGVQEPAQRAALYGRIAAIVLKDRPVIYLYHPNVLWAYTKRLQGLRPIPDGLVRVRGVRLD
jgi:peptide/nickel transport system substrate-binding protein